MVEVVVGEECASGYCLGQCLGQEAGAGEQDAAVADYPVGVFVGFEEGFVGLQLYEVVEVGGEEYSVVKRVEELSFGYGQDRDVEDGIKAAVNNKITLNYMFDLYMAGKYELKDSTRSNYLYMYENYVSGEIGRKKVASIKYSDVKAFYNSLIREKGFKPTASEN